MRNCIGQVSIRTIYTDNGPIPLGWRCNESNNACKNHKKGGFFWHSWGSGWSRAILLVCQWKANIQRSDFTDNRVHGSARPPVGVRGMYQSESNNTHIDGTQNFVCEAFPHHLNEVSPGRAVLFLTWRTPLRYRLGKAKGRQKSHFLPFPNLYRQAYYNHNRELRNMYYHIP